MIQNVRQAVRKDVVKANISNLLVKCKDNLSFDAFHTSKSMERHGLYSGHFIHSTSSLIHVVLTFTLRNSSI